LVRLKIALEGLGAEVARAEESAVERGAVERAAVAAVLREGIDGTEVLLIERAAHPDDPWSGHMALPGGRMDRSDTDLHATATRETLEEVGLDLQTHAQLVGALPVVDTRVHGLDHAVVIAPFVFVLQGDPSMRAGPEVAALLWAPIGPLVSGALDTQVTVERRGVPLTLPGWMVSGRVVWGLTYRMLEGLFRAAGWIGR
jgi:8-oxo-dGTP pyrophosphatase MutT (NUDIX family)